jgi:Protein kinase domain
MSSSFNQRVEELFLAALDVAEDERAAFLDARSMATPDEIAEVRALLDLGESDLRRIPDSASATGVAVESSSTTTPRRVGAFTIQRRIASGGMGVVYEALQDNPRRAVALKVIHAGLASDEMLRRFQREAEILGRLEHDGIARIYEAGVEDATAEVGGSPQPYLAMELVDGESLREFASARRLTIRQRIELITKVAAAVEHAHGRGVVHRDLKPDNILVTPSGEPKILDFGIARVVEGDIVGPSLQTTQGSIMGTVPYMSPEQLSADPSEIDARSDVYALGVITFELLASSLPLSVTGIALPEAARIVRDIDPPSLGSLAPALRGDVETIVGKCLEKEPGRRYQSAAAFVTDLQRFLDDRPISARRPSATYRIGKFAARHRTLVGATAAIFVLLVAGIIVATSLLFRAQTAEGEARQLAKTESELRVTAEQETERAQAVFDFLLWGFGAMRDGAGTNDLTVRQMLDQAAAEIETRYVGRPEAEFAIREMIGSAYHQIGDPPAALTQLQRAIELGESLPRVRYKLISVFKQASMAAREAGRDTEVADGYLKRSVVLAVELLAKHDPEVGAAAQSLLGLLRQTREVRIAEVGRMADALVARMHDSPQRSKRIDGYIALVLGVMATWLANNDHSIAAALPVMRHNVVIVKRVFPDSDNLAVVMWMLATCWNHTDDADYRVSFAREFLECTKRVNTRKHWFAAAASSILGEAMALRGRPEEAEEAAELLIVGYERSREVSGDHARTWEALSRLGGGSFGGSLGSEPLPKDYFAVMIHPRIYATLRKGIADCTEAGSLLAIAQPATLYANLPRERYEIGMLAARRMEALGPIPPISREAIFAKLHHRLGEVDEARAAMTRLRTLCEGPDASEAERQICREVEAMLAGGR